MKSIEALEAFLNQDQSNWAFMHCTYSNTQYRQVDPFSIIEPDEMGEYEIRESSYEDQDGVTWNKIDN